MADDATDFEDRWANVPTEPTDEDDVAKKKAELLKLAAPPEPVVQPPQQVDPSRQMPVPAPAPEPPVPQTMLGRIFAPMAIPKFMPGAAEMTRPAPEPEPEGVTIKPKDIPKILEEVQKEDSPRDLGYAPVSSDLKPGQIEEEVRNAEVRLRQAMQPSKLSKLRPDVDAAIVEASNKYGLDPNMMRGIASIESNFTPESNRGRPTQYKGLFQIGTRGADSEWERHGQGDVYNARDNAMAAARLMRENIDRFRKATGQDPTPTQIYLMHQQGLGFYTRGTMTNIAGNPYPGMRGPQTPASFEQGWGRTLDNRTRTWMGDEAINALNPNASGGDMLSSTPVEDQLIKMSGGGVRTPQERALIQSLISPKPIDMTAPEPVPVSRVPMAGQEIRPYLVPKGGLQRTRELMPGQLPVRVPQAPITLPGSQPQIGTPGPSFMQTLMTTPTVLGTAGLHMAMQPPPPPPGPGLAKQARDVVAKAASETGATPLSAVTNPLGTLGLMYGNMGGQLKDYLARAYDIPDLTQPDTWTPETGQKLIQVGTDALRGASNADQAFTKGVVEGVASRANLPVGMAASFLAAGYGLTGSETMKGWAEHLMTQTMPAVADWAHQQAGDLKPDESKDLADFGGFLGRNVWGGPATTLLSAGGELAMPAIMSAAENYLPDLQKMGFVQSAEGADLTNMQGQYQVKTLPDGQHVMALTPGGQVVVSHKTMNAIGVMGLATMGFMFAGPQVARMTANLYRNYVPFDPSRNLPGTAGRVQAISTVKDLAKAETLSTQQPLIDIFNRWQQAFERDGRVAADPYAAQRVADNLHIHSASQQRNLVNSAMETGQLNLPTMKFSVTHTMKDIMQFGQENPDFADYMRLKLHHDELSHNNNIVADAVARGVTPQRMNQLLRDYPITHYDDSGIATTITDVSRALAQMERANPNLQNGLKAYLGYIDETRRFVSDGQWAPERAQTLTSHTIDMPHTPIFNSNTPAYDIWKSVRNEKTDPIFVLEREVDKALSNRMNNEILGNYIHSGPVASAASSSAAQKYPFMRVSDSYIKENAPHADSILTWKLNGETVKHVGDPFVVGLLNMEPAGFMGSTNAFLSISKKWFQNTTTGVFAPFFAPTASWRGWLQSLVTSPEWGKQVGPFAYGRQSFAPVIPIPRQLTPILERAWNTQIRSLSNYIGGTALGQLVGQQNINTATRAILSEVANFRRAFEQSGGMSKDWHTVENENRVMITRARSFSANPTFQGILGYFDRVVQPMARMWAGDPKYKLAVTEAGKKAYNVYRDAARGVADSPNFAWAYKNRYTTDPVTGRQIHPAKLAAEARRLTGDPSEKGAHWYKDMTDTVRKLPFYKGDVYSGVTGGIREGAARAAGATASFFRETTPWSGVLVQSPARTASAWINNPIRFGAWMTATQIMPQMTAYLWNRQLGPEYINYMMEGRSEHARNNRTYFGVPGKKPWEGIEMENFQEGIVARRITDVLMDQLFGRSPHTFKDEVWDFLGSVGKTMIVPPMPSTLTAVMSMYGMTAPEGYAGGAFMTKNKGYRDLNRQDNWFERGLRAMAPVIADMHGQFAAAAHTAQGGTLDELYQGTKAMGRRFVERTPVARDILGMHVPAAASTRITDEIYKRKDTIDDLTRFNRTTTNIVNTKGRSEGGMDLVRRFNPELVEEKAKQTLAPGLPQTKPSNPLYIATMKMMEQLFVKDSPSKGGHGYQSLWSQYGIYTRYIDSMRNIPDSNGGMWLEQFKKNPQRFERLQRAGVNVNDFRQVRDYYIDRRNRVAKEIFHYMRAAEQTIGQQLQAAGKIQSADDFTLDQLDPYAK